MFKNKSHRIVGICVCIFFLISCTETLNHKPNAKITFAAWNNDTRILEISGVSIKTNGIKKTTSLQIKSSTGKIDIAETTIRSDDTWQVKLANPPLIPCNVQLNNDSSSAIPVAQAPDNCDTQTQASINITTSNSATVLNVLPNGTIIEPARNLEIRVGESVIFTALASTSNVLYSWDFDGASSNRNIQNPGKITFNKAGSYRIKLLVKNTDGLADTTPDERIITVLPDNSQNGILSIPPTANILSPFNDNTINVGDSLSFIASSGISSSLIYQWDFNGATKDSTLRVPGEIAFYKAGSFQVSLATYDQSGIRSQNTASVNVTVLPAAGINQAPTSIIQSPMTDRIINTGDTINFSGAATDPENNTPYSFTWNFDNAFANENSLDPGNKIFNRAGVYKISFTATDSLGQSDTNPPSRFITVLDNAINLSHLPESTITSPAMDATFDVGTAVEFVGAGASADGNTPFTFLWTFDGVAPDSMMEIPDPVTFDAAGVYTIMFTVTDSLAQADPTPAEVTITIVDPAATPPDTPPATGADTPVGEISQPDADRTIAIGDTLNFRGQGTSDAGNEPLTFLWTFGGAAPDSTEQNPGDIIFDTAGVFTVTLTVTDSMNNADPAPPSITVTVEATPADAPTPAPADTPGGEIIQPDQDVTITVGDAVEFMGSGLSPGGNDPLTYLWDFDGGAAESTEQNPGPVIFNIEGMYEVTLTVTDSLDNVDPGPPSIIVTVEAAGTAPPADTAPVDPTPPADVPPEAPTGIIVSPDKSITITVGGSVNFAGDGESPVDSPLTYLWNFGGAAPDAEAQEPGEVMFETEGVFIVTLTVSDEAGLSDPEPPTVEITVEADD